MLWHGNMYLSIISAIIAFKYIFVVYDILCIAFLFAFLRPIHSIITS
jgi:hypothetical protein